MASFTSIPIADILFFLSSNNVIAPVNSMQAYEVAWQLLQSNQIEEAPVSIIDWIISYNLASNGTILNRLTTSSILFSPDDELIPLATILTLNNVDKERILRILGYLNILDNDMSIYDTLSEDVLLVILENLDCANILLTCKISANFNRLCQEGRITPLLRNKLRETTRLRLDQYNQQELANMCRYTNQINIAAADDHGFYIKEGKVYNFGQSADWQFNTVGVHPIQGLNNIKQISAGGRHLLALTNDGKVYVFGINGAGQLGLGHNDNIETPTLLELDNISEVSAGREHSLLLDINGQVYSFGDNSYGQLGLGDNFNRNKPIVLPIVYFNNKQPIRVSAGGHHSLLLTKDGEIYSFGNNTSGQLGLGDNNNRNIPTLVSAHSFNKKHIVQVSAGYAHSLVLTEESTVYSFGSGSQGRLGLGDTNNRNIPTLITTNYFNNLSISYVSAGRFYSLVLTDTGHIYSFGDIYYQQMGPMETFNKLLPTLISGINNIVQVSTGGAGYLILNKQGEVYYFGKSQKEKGTPLLLTRLW